MSGLLGLFVTSSTHPGPKLPGRSLAPTSATLLASSIEHNASRPAPDAGAAPEIKSFDASFRILLRRSERSRSASAAFAACQPGIRTPRRRRGSPSSRSRDLQIGVR